MIDFNAVLFFMMIVIHFSKILETQDHHQDSHQGVNVNMLIIITIINKIVSFFSFFLFSFYLFIYILLFYDVFFISYYACKRKTR